MRLKDCKMNISTINSIEVSALCNLHCKYCPASIQHKHRPVGLMEMATFEKAVEWVSMFCDKGTQMELNLFGVGEPTLNPNLVDMVKHARRKLPFRQVIHTNTNGLLMTKELAIALKQAGLNHIDITGHDAFHTAKTIRIFREVGIEGQLSVDYMTNTNNWAGQVEWFEPQYNAGPCPWLGRGQCFILWNGDVTTCCIDAFGQGIVGNIFEDDLTRIDLKPFKLCEGCHHTLPETTAQGRIVQRQTGGLYAVS